MNPYKSMTIKCRLTRLTDNGHTRTQTMVGVTDQIPTVGRRFDVLNDDPLVKTAKFTNRLISTSEVQSVEPVWSNTIKFKTENTEYLYEELP